MPKVRGGRERKLTTLQIRQQQWDAQKDKDGTKRPGSNKK